MKSIVSNEKECFVCKTTQNLHKHHIFYARGNRTKSEEDGCWVYLCAYHHNMSNMGVHMNIDLDMQLKRLTQCLWEEHNNKTTEDFIKRFGRNYK